MENGKNREGWIYKPDGVGMVLANLSDWRACTLETMLVALQVSFYRNDDQERLGIPEVEQLLIHPETAEALARGLMIAAKGAREGPPPQTLSS